MELIDGVGSFLPFDSRRLASQNAYPTPRGFRFLSAVRAGYFMPTTGPGHVAGSGVRSLL